MLNDPSDRQRSGADTREHPSAQLFRARLRPEKTAALMRGGVLARWYLDSEPAARRAGRANAACILNKQTYALEALFLDALIIVLAGVAAGALYDVVAYNIVGDLTLPLRSGLIVALLFAGLARLKAADMPFGTSGPFERARDGLSSWVTAFTLFLFVAFILKDASHLSRGATICFFVIGSVAIALSRSYGPVLAALLLRKSALASRDVIVIGPTQDSVFTRLLDDLGQTTGASPRVVTFNDECGVASWPDALRNLVGNAVDHANRAGPGDILMVPGRLSVERLSVTLDALAIIPRSIRLVPDELTASCLRQKVTTIGESVALEIQRAPLEMPQRLVKRAIDIVCSGIAIVVFLPAFLAIAAAIKFDSSGPVLFRQSRTGCRGRIFKIFKFRTMTVLEDGPQIAQARQRDNRVTRVGFWLRRMSFDELPQLFNVLKGDMSLIGPRPHAVAHDNLYGGQIVNYALRQHVKPGISGWAQVNGLRGETSTLDAMRRRVEHDLWYVRHYSLLLDLEIAARTLFEIVRRRNAY